MLPSLSFQLSDVATLIVVSGGRGFEHFLDLSGDVQRFVAAVVFELVAVVAQVRHGFLQQ